MSADQEVVLVSLEETARLSLSDIFHAGWWTQSSSVATPQLGEPAVSRGRLDDDPDLRRRLVEVDVQSLCIC